MSVGYHRGPWPCEDGGPTRPCSARVEDFDVTPIDPAGQLKVTEREIFAPTMVVMGDHNQVYVQGHSLGPETTAWVEQIDPLTLAPIAKSPDLAAGPFWPGGVAAHSNGSLYVTYGNWCHRLSLDCELLASSELPRQRPYNSLTVFDDGSLAMKDLIRDESENSQALILDPGTLEPLISPVDLPEPTVARISSAGTTLYVVGTASVFRYQWDARIGSLELDDSWRVHYRNSPVQSYGWDPVIADGCLWFMDNGAHNYSTTMLRAGVAEGPVHLICAPVGEGATGEFKAIEISGLPGGAITNPPLVDTGRKIAVAYDSANGVATAWRYELNGGSASVPELTQLWKVGISTSCHLVLYPGTGTLVLNDFRDGVDNVVFFDIETGNELARAATTSPVQSVLFLSPGANRDLYYCSFARLARIFN